MVDGESEPIRVVRRGRERYVCTGISKRISEMGSRKKRTMGDIVQKMKGIIEMIGDETRSGWG